MKYKHMAMVVLLMLTVLSPSRVLAQSVKRQCVSSYCTVISNSDAPLEQTAGQPFNTTVSHDQCAMVLPGFQQALLLNGSAGDEPVGNNLAISVYPNPASTLVTIKAQEEITEPTIILYDLSGKVVWMANPDSFTSYPLGCENWPDGIYILKINDVNQNGFSTKLIINK